MGAGGAGEERVVAHSLKTKAQAAMSRVLPDAVKARQHAKVAELGLAGDA